MILGHHRHGQRLQIDSVVLVHLPNGIMRHLLIHCVNTHLLINVRTTLPLHYCVTLRSKPFAQDTTPMPPMRLLCVCVCILQQNCKADEDCEEKASRSFLKETN